MPLNENTHVTFTNDEGGSEVGVVKKFEDGKYKVERKNKEVVSVNEDKVQEFHPSSADKESCPVVGHAK